MNTASRQRRPTARQIGKARLGVPIEEFRTRNPKVQLSPRERFTLLDGLETMFEGAYSHLPLKRARYGFDPVQRLRILRMQAASLSPEAFDAEVDDIFNRLRDFHTVYYRPGFEGQVAALPCSVEMYSAGGKPRYMVSKVGEWCKEREFVAGVLVESWNGVPIDRALQRYADQESGGRADSMRSAAIATLTLRPLSNYSLPDEDTVTVGFRKVNAQGEPVGKRQFVTLGWRVLNSRFVDRFREGAKRRTATKARVRAINPAAAAIKKAKLLMYAPEALRGESKEYWGEAAIASVGWKIRCFRTELPDFLRAWKLRGSQRGQEYGYLRIFEFDVPGVRAFLEELRRLLALMPPQGLILDLRGNPGGVVVAAEMALQFFTPRTIEPVRFALLASDFNRKISALANNRADLGPWQASLREAVRNGELYSAPLPITDPSKCNVAGQVYGGPVILVADPSTYSSGDLFSAGFVDNSIGHMLCVGESTGAGGASVWDYADMRRWAGVMRRGLPRLPEGGVVQFAYMRATRVGPRLGTLIEDVGVSVRPENQYAMTRNDLLCENRDLLARCIAWLERQPYTVMSCVPDKKRGTIDVVTDGLDQLDVTLDHHRLESVQIKDAATHTFARPPGTQRVEVCGLKRGVLKQRRVMDTATMLEA
jgi:Peptidase family S41